LMLTFPCAFAFCGFPFHVLAAGSYWTVVLIREALFITTHDIFACDRIMNKDRYSALRERLGVKVSMLTFIRTFALRGFPPVVLPAADY
jgi:hypothetical protein